MGTELSITACGIFIAPITSFDYLGIVLSSTEKDWTEVVHNLQRALQKGAQLTRVFSREGTGARRSGQTYFVVVQSVIIYGLET